MARGLFKYQAGYILSDSVVGDAAARLLQIDLGRFKDAKTTLNAQDETNNVCSVNRWIKSE